LASWRKIKKNTESWLAKQFHVQLIKSEYAHFFKKKENTITSSVLSVISLIENFSNFVFLKFTWKLFLRLSKNSNTLEMLDQVFNLAMYIKGLDSQFR
jgi:hypothetical protein